jgi:arylsulfatase A-like enzyme
LLKDPQAERPREAIYYSYHDDAVPAAKVPQHEGIQTDRYKLIYFPAQERWELYDRETDPKERHNLALDPGHLDLLDSLRAQFWKVRASYGAPEPNSLRPGPFAQPGRMTPAPYLGERYWE